jgi:hypothetical protein
MLMAHIYLDMKNWTKAKEKAGEVISSSPHSLISNYENIFGVKNEFNAENIWEIDHTADKNPSSITDACVPRAFDEPSFPEYTSVMNGFGLTSSSAEFIASFDSEDLRRKMYNWPHDFPELKPSKAFTFHYVYKNIEFGIRSNHNLNKIIYRLADAYLMYAEAENQLNGPTPDAFEKINTIRKRAFTNNTTKLYSLSILSSKDAFQQAIVNERKWELGFEGFRRWDLNRWGILVKALNSQTITNQIGIGNFKDFHNLLPIPAEEIALNPSLVQNPGY